MSAAAEPTTERRRYRRQYIDADQRDHSPGAAVAEPRRARSSSAAEQLAMSTPAASTLRSRPRSAASTPLGTGEQRYGGTLGSPRSAASPPRSTGEQRHAGTLRKRTAALAAARMAVLKLTHAFYTWRRSAADAAIWRESAQAQALLVQAQRLIRNRTRRHFRAWLSYMISLRQEWIAEEHMLESKLLGAFSAWVGVVERGCALREGMMRLCMGRAVRLLTASFDQLIEHATSEQHRRMLLARAAGRLRSRLVGAAFAGWVRFADARNVTHAEALRTVWAAWKGWAARSGGIERRAFQLLQRWKLRYQTRALRRWVEWVDARRRCALTLQLLQGKRLERTTTAVFDRWLLYADSSARSTHVLVRAASAFRRCSLRKAWNSWNELSRLQSTRRRKAVASLCRRQQYAGFQGWLEYTHGIRERRQKLSKALVSLSRGCIASAWRTWRSNAQEAARKAQNLRGVLNIMLRRQLHRAFAGLVEIVAARCSLRLAQNVKLARALARIGCKSLAWAWQEWTQWCALSSLPPPDSLTPAKTKRPNPSSAALCLLACSCSLAHQVTCLNVY